MNSRIPIVFLLQEMDRVIFEAENNMEVSWDDIYELYHRRASLSDKLDWIMTPWR